MKKTIIIFSLLFFTPTLFASDAIEKIIVIRHGEKPFLEIGQLNCKGLNRSLALPNYFKNAFPTPDYIFAPNPSIEVPRHFTNLRYSYIRPLATIEPTAIRLGMPVNAQIGFNQPAELMDTLLAEKYHHSVIYAAWEHRNIVYFARLLLSHFNNDTTVPDWDEDNYDMVFVFTIDWRRHPAVVNFSVTNEGLNNLSDQCPN